MSSFTIHPLAERFPVMAQKDFDELKESIRKYGLFEPIIVNDKGQILDGRHRYKAITELGVHHPSSDTLGFDDVKGSNKDLTEEQFIYDSNIHRRHLTDDQRAMLATAFAPYFHQEAQERKTAPLQKPGEPSHHQKSVEANSTPLFKRDMKAKESNSTRGKVAAKAGVSTHKAEQAIRVSQDPELSAQVANGTIPLVTAAKEVTKRKLRKAKVKILNYETIEKAWNKFLNKYPAADVSEVKRIVFDILAAERE